MEIKQNVNTSIVSNNNNNNNLQLSSDDQKKYDQLRLRLDSLYLDNPNKVGHGGDGDDDGDDNNEDVSNQRSII